MSKTSSSTRQRTTWRRRTIGGCILCAIAISFASFTWGNWPTTVSDDYPASCDAVIVLGGGDALVRSSIAIDVIKKSNPLRVIVTGDGGKIYREIKNRRLEDLDLHHETNAESTYENAQFTLPIAKDFDAKKIIVVTNWFHSFRSKRTFQSVYGNNYDIRVICEPTPIQFNKYDHQRLRHERFKIGYYALRYGINPW